jgi:hypothetical protein
MTGCCEYVDINGHTKTVFQCLCACDEVDATFDALLRGEKIKENAWDRVITVISDRVRIPWFGGARRISGFALLCPLLLSLFLFVGSFSFVATLVTTTTCMLGGPVMISVKSMRSVRLARMHILFYWTYWSIAFVIREYFSSLRNDLSSRVVVASCDSLIFLLVFVAWKLQTIDPGMTKTTLMPIAHDAMGLLNFYISHKSMRLKYCRITGASVRRYDHYCIWISKPIGAANHRLFILFLFLLSLGGTVFVALKLSVHYGRMPSFLSVVYSNNLSNYSVVITCYVCLASAGIVALLVHQLFLIGRNLTSYEAKHFPQLAKCDLSWRENCCEDEGFVRNCIHFWRDNEKGRYVI